DFQGAAGAPGQVDASLGQLAPVMNGDYLELNGGAQVHVITGVSKSSQTLATTRLLISVPQNSRPEDSPSFRIIRQPRPLPGEDILALPQDMAVDLTLDNGTPPSTLYSRNIPTRTVTSALSGRLTLYEIVFSPRGAVVGQNTPSGKIILWLRNTTKPV